MSRVLCLICCFIASAPLASGSDSVEVDDMALLQTQPGVLKQHAPSLSESPLAALQRDFGFHIVAQQPDDDDDWSCPDGTCLRVSMAEKLQQGPDNVPVIAPDTADGDKPHWTLGGLNGTFYSAHSNRTRRDMTQSEKDEILAQTNLRRCMHGAPDVQWSDPVAQNLEEFIRGQSMSTMHHANCYELSPPYGPAGENLFGGSTRYAPAAAVDAWYSEVNDCQGGDTGFADGCQNGVGGAPTGHFTALVWTGVTHIGCAYSDNEQVIGCRYWSGDSLSADTPNMQGYYRDKVLVRSQTEAQCSAGSSSPSPSSGGSSPAPAPAPTTPAPTTTPAGSSVSGPSGNCLSHSGCTITNACGRTVHLQFSCRYQGGPPVTVGTYFPVMSGYSGFAGICGNYCQNFNTLN